MAKKISGLTHTEMVCLTEATKALFGEESHILGLRLVLRAGRRDQLAKVAQTLCVTTEKLRTYAQYAIDQFDSDETIPELGAYCLL